MLGSATITSWPSSSSHRATHSLSVDASIRIFARARSANTFTLCNLGVRPEAVHGDFCEAAKRWASRGSSRAQLAQYVPVIDEVLDRVTGYEAPDVPEAA
jgi:hypothetical protein